MPEQNNSVNTIVLEEMQAVTEVKGAPEEHDIYAALATHFQRDDVGLQGFAQFFQARASATAPDTKETSENAPKLTPAEVDLMLQQPKTAVEPTPDVPVASPKKTPEEAFQSGDVAASKAAHTKEEVAIRIASTEQHSVVGERLKSIVYGGLDGIITTFAVVAGATGGHLDTSVILILGVSNMFADAVSMGMGDAISTKAENEMILMERDREKWEWEECPEGELEEMVQLYTQRGLDSKQAKIVVDAMATNDDFFVDQMVIDELGMQLPDEDDNPWFDGLITFTSFVFFGVFPLLAYICLNTADIDQDTLFGLSCGLTAIMLFILGVVKSQFTKQLWYVAGSEILGLGGFTAAVSYGIGALVAEIV